MRKLVLWSCCAVSKTLENVSERKLLRKLWIVSQEIKRNFEHSSNGQNTRGADHFWKLRCRKSARRCGAKHISKWKCTKHTILGALLEVAMSKKCTPLWREAHFEVKMNKTHHVRTTFGSWDVEKVSQKCTPLWREAHFGVKSVKNCVFLAFFDVLMSKK